MQIILKGVWCSKGVSQKTVGASSYENIANKHNLKDKLLFLQVWIFWKEVCLLDSGADCATIIGYKAIQLIDKYPAFECGALDYC